MPAAVAGSLRLPFLGSQPILRMFLQEDALLTSRFFAGNSGAQTEWAVLLPCSKLFLVPWQVSDWWPPPCKSQYGQCKSSGFLTFVFWRQLTMLLHPGIIFPMDRHSHVHLLLRANSATQVENWRVDESSNANPIVSESKKTKDKTRQGLNLQIHCASKTHNPPLKAR